MNVTIELSEQNAAVLEAQARAAHMSPKATSAKSSPERFTASTQVRPRSISRGNP